MQDCYYERDTEIGDSEEQDSGNNHLNEPRTGMSVDENFLKKWIFSVMKSTRHTGSLQLLRGNENYIRSQVANLSKILNGQQGNVV